MSNWNIEVNIETFLQKYFKSLAISITDVLTDSHYPYETSLNKTPANITIGVCHNIESLLQSKLNKWSVKMVILDRLPSLWND